MARTRDEEQLRSTYNAKVPLLHRLKEEAAFDAETPTEILAFGLPHLETPAHYAIAAE